MPYFQKKTKLCAAVASVASFHHDTRALKRLTPPPIFVQLHAIEPLAEGSLAEFTLWFGPLPVRWLAKHSQVNRQTGFTDEQVRGPLHIWVHTHRWSVVDHQHTLLEDCVHYQHHPGWRGLLTRLLFAPPMLWLMFTYRHFVTRRALEHPNS